MKGKNSTEFPFIQNNKIGDVHMKRDKRSKMLKNNKKKIIKSEIAKYNSRSEEQKIKKEIQEESKIIQEETNQKAFQDIEQTTC